MARIQDAGRTKKASSAVAKKKKPVAKVKTEAKRPTSKGKPESLAAGKKRVGKVIDKVVAGAKKIKKDLSIPDAPKKKTKLAEALLPGERSKMHQVIAGALDDMLDGIERDYALTGSSMDSNESRLSTGSLVLDLILGKGLIPGWYTVFGQEQSCKSTAATTFMAAALNTDVPIISYWDYEGSASPGYISNILEVSGIKMTIEHVFGIRDPKTSNWAVKPRVRYYSESVAEKFFDYLAKLERALPDKVCINEKWYLVYPGKVANSQGKMVVNKAAIAIVKDDYDKNYLRKTGKYRIEAENDSLQALVIVDSYPAMLPEKQDVDDPNSAIAVQARMFSEQIKRVKGKLRAKRIAVIGVNQLRTIPMAMYGPSEMEPCGTALKFFSDVRLKFTPRALSGVPEVKGKGYLEEEESVTHEGVDTYRFIHVRAQKNKLSTPNLEGWMRLWITDANGEGRGFDPVWDCFQYLRSTGQIAGKRTGFKFTIPGKETKNLVSWMQFKAMVLGDTKTIRATCEELKLKPFRIRDLCNKQLATGKGLEMYYETKRVDKNEEVGGGGDSDESDDSDDE